MSATARQKGQDFASFLQSLPEEVRLEGNRAEFERAKADHEDFKTKFDRGVCYLCGAPLDSFDRTKPCAHWLLKPKGFGKGDFPAVTKKFGPFQLQSFLRWVANEEAFARNINNLEDEGTGKLIELTIKYKNLEWCFSCSESDYLGHATSKHASHSHYHFQMRVNGYQFINYNDFHIRLKDKDIHHIEAMRATPGVIKPRFSFGEGMGEVMREDMLEDIVETKVSTDESDEAPFKIDTLITADEGTTISGETIFNILQEAKAKNVTAASLFRKMVNVSTKVIVSPGPGVVEQAPRSGGRRKKS